MADSTSATRSLDISFYFSLDVDGYDSLGDFMMVEELKREREPFVYREGGRNDHPHILFGAGSYGELILRWGLMDRSRLWKWMDAVKLGEAFRRSGVIHQYTRSGKVIRRYYFEDAWPVGWKGPRLNSLESEIPIEEIHIACHKIKVETYDVE